MRLKGDACADLAKVRFQALLFGSKVRGLIRVAFSKLIAKLDFLIIGKPGQTHGRAREVALDVGGYFQHCVCGNAC